MRGERLRQRAPRLLRDVQRGCRGRGQQRGVAQGGQIDEPDPIGELRRQLGGDLHGQACLAAAAGAGEGEEPGGDQQVLDLGHLAHASDEAVDLGGQVMRGRGSGSRGRCFGRVPAAPHRALVREAARKNVLVELRAGWLRRDIELPPQGFLQ